MPIDPARLARIRSRLLAAAAVTAASTGCGGPEHVNTRPPDVIVNEPVHDVPPAGTTGAAPDATGDTPPDTDPGPEQPHINTPPPDRVTPADAVRTINTPPDEGPAAPTASGTTASPPKPGPGHHVNRPKPPN